MTESIFEKIKEVGKKARQASYQVARASTAQKNDALMAMAQTIDDRTEFLLQANKKDVDRARTQPDVDEAFINRLVLTPSIIGQMAEGLRQIAKLPDPVGEMTDCRFQPSGIQVGKMRVPLGVIGIIYESRPNVTADASGLCLKSGNATILRGGSEAIYSNQAIAECIRTGLKKAGLPENAIQVIDTTDREAVGILISSPEYVDVIVPRGGKSLTERIAREASVPVIKHLDGICHVYIDEFANIEKAVKVSDNAKTQRYAPCNAMETLLIHQQSLSSVWPLLEKIYLEKSVELRGCDILCQFSSAVISATELDWSTEYLAPVLSIKVVDSLDEAIDHINQYGSHHTDAIITENYTNATRFLREVDSASVMVNASTRFADGFEYGLGAEIGISTDKLHARGPVGLEGLTSQKWVVFGDGHIRI